MRRRLSIVMLLIVVVAAGGYAAGGYVLYDMVTRLVRFNCDKFPGNTPVDFTADLVDQGVTVDEAPYQMPGYETVQFPSRDDGAITIDAWHIETTEDAPTILIVHGLDSCKATPAPLLTAGMLHNAGYNVLLIDMRNHGDSTVTDMRFDAGTVEYLDVLGAWDWLVEVQGIAPAQIGLLGVSLGGATSLIAFGEEPQLAAIWVDSSYADLGDAITNELRVRGLPVFLKDAGLRMGILVGGVDVTSRSPIQAVENINQRPIFITHGAADERMSVEFAYQLETAIIEGDNEVELWVVEGSGHILALFEQPETYAERLVGFFDEVFAQ